MMYSWYIYLYLKPQNILDFFFPGANWTLLVYLCARDVDNSSNLNNSVAINGGHSNATGE